MERMVSCHRQLRHGQDYHTSCKGGGPSRIACLRWSSMLHAGNHATSCGQSKSAGRSYWDPSRLTELGHWSEQPCPLCRHESQALPPFPSRPLPSRSFPPLGFPLRRPLSLFWVSSPVPFSGRLPWGHNMKGNSSSLAMQLDGRGRIGNRQRRD